MLEWVPAMFVLLGVVETVRSLRATGPGGRERFARLSDDKARALHDNCRSRALDYSHAAIVAVSMVGVILAVLSDRLPAVLAWSAAALATAASSLTWRRARPDILAAFADSDLEALPRETSQRRTRLTRRLMITAVLAYSLHEITYFLGRREDLDVLMIVAALALLTAFVAAGWMVFAWAWRFGDEQSV